MDKKLMILPAKDRNDIRLIRIPEDFEEHEVYRYVTGLIAQAEENSECDWEEISDLLEEKGFETVEFIMGPSLD